MQKEKIKDLKDKLLQLLKKKALKKGRFILSSGKISNYYLDGRLITLNSEGAYLVAKIILEMIKDKDIIAIGGPTLGADPIVGAVITLSHLYKIPLKGFIVRKSAKTHGMQKLIEGPVLKKGSKVVLVDDVATTGKSLLEAKMALDKMGLKTKEVIVIVDRNEGASKNLKRVGLKLNAIFKIKELL